MHVRVIPADHLLPGLDQDHLLVVVVVMVVVDRVGVVRDQRLQRDHGLPVVVVVFIVVVLVVVFIVVVVVFIVVVVPTDHRGLDGLHGYRFHLYLVKLHDLGRHLRAVCLDGDGSKRWFVSGGKWL
ncbi:hypothetical protein EYF80_025682 [Liparis tanakae]|uniref:Uncharacterized protein n=1 Tax=Liparis tanakae TaxID=230148 RepID=A0A4Z2HGL5_9TELE|nr:hypothetical protein EYF80_025682 [Liparis tanakae]